MKNLIKSDAKEVELLKHYSVQVWLNSKGCVRLTQRLQLTSSYAVMKLSNEGVTSPADTLYGDELLNLIQDDKWVEITDAVICRESDVKEEVVK